MLFKMDQCGGCRTCELACGYHHEGVFRPAMSSIKIVEKECEPGYAVMFEEETTGSTRHVMDVKVWMFPCAWNTAEKETI